MSPIYEYECLNCGKLHEIFQWSKKVIELEGHIECIKCGSINLKRREIPSKLGPINPRPDDVMEKIKEVTDKKARKYKDVEPFGERNWDELKK